MTSDGSVTHWLGQLQAGDRASIQQLWERYFHAWHRRQANVCQAQRRWAEAVRHLDRLPEMVTGLAHDAYQRGRNFANLNQWDQAAAAYTRALTRHPDDLEWWSPYSVVLLARDDTAGRRRLCAELLGRFGRSDNAVLRDEMVRLCVRLPGAVDDPARLVPLAENDRRAEHYLGAALYRAGRFADAVRELQRAAERPSLVPPETSAGWLLLALAQQRVGNAAEARRWLAKAVEQLDGGQVRLPLNVVPLRRLRAEAEGLIGRP